MVSMVHGKSTLLKTLAGLLLPAQGSVIIDEIDTKEKKKKKELRKKVGMVFQNPENQFVFSEVEDDMQFTLENFGFSKEQTKQRIKEALTTVAMEKYKEKKIEELSMGQKQRIAIAEMLALEPEYLLFDEPTAMLDPESKKTVIQTIKKLNQEKGITILYATNIIQEILKADRIIALEKGEICFECTPNEIIKKEEEFQKIGLQIPEILELIVALQKKGIDFNVKEYDVPTVVEELWRKITC